jgi:hypothetical protein
MIISSHAVAAVHRAVYNVLPVVRGEKRPNCRCGKDSTLKNLGLSPDSTTYVCVDHDPRKYTRKG